MKKVIMVTGVGVTGAAGRSACLWRRIRWYARAIQVTDHEHHDHAPDLMLTTSPEASLSRVVPILA